MGVGAGVPQPPLFGVGRDTPFLRQWFFGPAGTTLSHRAFISLAVLSGIRLVQMNQITLTQYLEAYRSAVRVHAGQMSLTEAKKHLAKAGLNENTAVDLVRDYQKLRAGHVYKRALSAATTDDFLKWILRDSGTDAHRTAVKALAQHIKYYQGYSGSPMKSHVAVLEKHRAMANTHSDPVQAASAISTDIPVACWIFQYNPDNNPVLESDIRPGTAITWHVGQQPSRMEVGQGVYLWRAAGQKKRPSGIVATASILAGPAVRQQYTQHLGEKRKYDTGDPEMCALLRIERVYLEEEKMLLKEALKNDSVLEDLEILTMARHTNYPIEGAAQALRLSELLGLDANSFLPVYKDFGEAPNDDPNELRIFAAKVRRGQVQFRNKLIQLYGGKCAITGNAIQEVLEACHVAFHAESGINHSGNGILLRSDIHTLFDEGLLDIDSSTMTVVVAPRLKQSDYWRHHGQQLPARTDGSQISREHLAARHLVAKKKP